MSTTKVKVAPSAWRQRPARAALRSAAASMTAAPPGMLELKLAAATSEWQMILPVGNYNTEKYGELDFTVQFCQRLVANWKGKVMGNRQPFVDVNHDRGEAQGWIADLDARPDGLYAKIEWTDPGKDKVEKKTYRYFSPDIAKHQDLAGAVHYPVLVGLALTNTPVMNNLADVKLSDLTPARSAPIIQGSQRRMATATPAHQMGTGAGAMNDFEKFLEMLKGMVGPDASGLTPEQKDSIIDVLIEGEVDTAGAGEVLGKDGQPIKADDMSEEALAARKLAKRLAFGKKLCGDQMAEKAPPAPPAGTVEKAAGEAPEEHKSTQTPQPVQASERPAAPAALNGDAYAIVLAELKKTTERLNRMEATNTTDRKAKVLEMALAEGKIQVKDRATWEARFDQAPDMIERVLADLPTNPMFKHVGHGEAPAALSLSESESAAIDNMGVRMGWTKDETEQFKKTGRIVADKKE